MYFSPVGARLRFAGIGLQKLIGIFAMEPARAMVAKPKGFRFLNDGEK